MNFTLFLGTCKSSYNSCTFIFHFLKTNKTYAKQVTCEYLNIFLAREDCFETGPSMRPSGSSHLKLFFMCLVLCSVLIFMRLAHEKILLKKMYHEARPCKLSMRLAHGNKPNFGVVTVTTLSTFFLGRALKSPATHAGRATANSETQPWSSETKAMAMTHSHTSDGLSFFQENALSFLSPFFLTRQSTPVQAFGQGVNGANIQMDRSLGGGSGNFSFFPQTLDLETFDS